MVRGCRESSDYESSCSFFRVEIWDLPAESRQPGFGGKAQSSQDGRVGCFFSVSVQFHADIYTLVYLEGER